MLEALREYPCHGKPFLAEQYRDTTRSLETCHYVNGQTTWIPYPKENRISTMKASFDNNTEYNNKTY